MKHLIVCNIAGSSNGPPKARLRRRRVGHYNMWYVYILKSLNFRKSYVGCSNDVERRIHEHNSGKSMYTRRYKPWVLLKKEECNDYKEARIRELFYKSGVGRKELKRLFN